VRYGTASACETWLQKKSNLRIASEMVFYMFVLIVPPHFAKDSGIVESPNPVVILIRCGQDYEVKSLAAIMFAQISCLEFNGTYSI